MLFPWPAQPLPPAPGWSPHSLALLAAWHAAMGWQSGARCYPTCPRQAGQPLILLPWPFKAGVRPALMLGEPREGGPSPPALGALSPFPAPCAAHRPCRMGLRGAAGAAQLPGSCSQGCWGTRRSVQSGERRAQACPRRVDLHPFTPPQPEQKLTLGGRGTLFCREQAEERFASANPSVQAGPSSARELPYPCTGT